MDTGFTTEQDNYCVTSGPEGLKIWDITAKCLVKALSIPAFSTFRSTILSILPDGRILTLGSPEVAKISNVLSGATISTSVDFDCANPILHGTSSPVTQQIACVTGANLVIFNIDKPNEPDVLTGHDDQISCISFHPKLSLLLSGAQDSTIKLWDTDLKFLKHTFGGHNGPITSVAWLGDEYIVSGSEDTTVKIWSSKISISHHSCIKEIPHFSPVTAVDGSLASTSSPLLASGTSKGIVRCFQMPSASMRFASKAFDEPISSVCFTEDGKYIIATGTKFLKVFDVFNNGNIVFQTKVSTAAIYSCVSTNIIPVLLANASTLDVSSPQYFDPSLQGRYGSVDISRIFAGNPLICPGCQNAIVDPHPSRTVQTSCCNSIWCKDCILYRVSKEPNCPSCTKPCTEQNLFEVADAWEEASIVISCQFTGCPWKSNLSPLLKHESRCQYAPTRCDYTHSGCTHIGTRKDIFAHQEECKYRPIKCKYAEKGCMAITPFLLSQDHLETDCKFQPVDCPNKSLGCTCPQTERKNSVTYMRKHCIKYGIPCTHAELGCKWRGLDHSLGGHLTYDCHFHHLRDILTNLHSSIDTWKSIGKLILESNNIEDIHKLVQDQLNQSTISQTPNEI